MIRTALSLLALTTALSACADEARREFIYKPAYCLASGLADMGNEECLPQMLKEKAQAVAEAKLKDATAEVPSPELKVYYTPDQRLGLSYEIARQFFAPSKDLKNSSAAMSLEAANIIEPASAVKEKCDADVARRDVINAVRTQITDMAVNRDTAKFLSEHYTDLQISELYRVAQAGGTMADVKDDFFIMDDPKTTGKKINVKPKADTQLGGIISFTTSRVASDLVKTQNKELVALRDARIAERAAKACPPPAPKVEAPVAEEAPAITEEPQAPTKAPKKASKE